MLRILAFALLAQYHKAWPRARRRRGRWLAAAPGLCSSGRLNGHAVTPGRVLHLQRQRVLRGELRRLAAGRQVPGRGDESYGQELSGRRRR